MVRILIYLIVFTFVLHAQPIDRAEVITARMKEQLSLTDEQTSKVGEIVRQFVNQVLREQDSYSTHREKMKALISRMEMADAEIEKFLTKEQRKKFERYREERRNEMRERMKERQH